MIARDDGSRGFWVVWATRGGRRGPLTVDLPGLGEAVAVFSFEEEASLYLRLRGEEPSEAGGLRAMRVSGPRLLELLSGRWSGFGSVALDPMPELDAGTLLPLTTTSREGFVRSLAAREDARVRPPMAAAAL